jgi:hypothetical protein
MFPLLIPMAIGAGIGALTNKKDPLKGGLLGAGLGAAGGAFAPGLLGGSGAASAALPVGVAGPVAPTMGAGLPGIEAFATGYTPQGLLGAAGQYMKPAGEMASMAQKAGLLDPQQQQVMNAPPPMQQMNTGAQTLGQIAQAGMSEQKVAEDAAARKKRRMGLLGAA